MRLQHHRTEIVRVEVEAVQKTDAVDPQRRVGVIELQDGRHEDLHPVGLAQRVLPATHRSHHRIEDVLKLYCSFILFSFIQFYSVLFSFIQFYSVLFSFIQFYLFCLFRLFHVSFVSFFNYYYYCFYFLFFLFTEFI